MTEFDRRKSPAVRTATDEIASVAPGALRARSGRLHVIGLCADYLERPVGLGNPTPRLSWRIESDERNVRQAAYRIRVASTLAALRAGRCDLWDSEQVYSKESFNIEYAGRHLSSRQRCWWTVEVWDEHGNSARSNGSDSWELGLLHPQDWSAQWLAVEGSIARDDRKTGLKWIWGRASPDRPAHRFRFEFELPEPSSGGELIAVVKQTFWWSQITRIWLDGVAIAGPGRWVERPPAPFDAPPATTVSNLTSQRLALQPLRRGRHVLAVEAGTRPLSSWSFATPETPPNVPGIAALARFELEGGGTLRLTSGPRWKADSSDDAVAEWHGLDFDDSRWGHVIADTSESYQPWPAQPAMHLRRTFGVGRNIVAARLYITALGVYEAWLNGIRIGDEVLSPGPAQYDECVPYQVFDIGALVQAGQNVIAITVADGWYASFDGRFAFAPPPRRLIAQLELTFEDGQRETIATGPGWRVAEGAIRSSQIKFGEIHDRRFDAPELHRATFDDSHWEEALEIEAPTCRLVAQSAPPIRIKRRVRPRAINRTTEGDFVIDFGMCFGGWCELRVTGKAGTRIELKYSEVLGPTDEVDQARLYDDPCGDARGDVFILRGDPAGEQLASRFVYRGFRYVQVSGVESALHADAVEGAFVHSDLAETGSIRSDNHVIRGIFNLALQSQKSNFVGVPVDNNTREVRGYVGEMGVFGEAAAYLMDVSTFFARHIDMAVAAQEADGTFPLYAPRPRHANACPQPGETPGWGSSVIVVAFHCWRHYGDTAIIARNWEAMNRNLQLVLTHNPTYLWLDKRGFDFGDWLSLEPTPKDLFATAIWAYSATLLAQMAVAIGKPQDAARLTALRDHIREAFNVAFVKADGVIGNGSQTSYVLPLAFDLLPKDLRGKAADRLAATIRGRSPPALTTGTWGTRFILDVLIDGGHADLAYQLLTSASFPSWGYMLRHGATAMWENWDREKRGTRNQPAFGSVAGFLFRRVAGIGATAPGFRTIRICPQLNSRIAHGGGHYDSVMGRIATEWSQPSDGSFSLEVTIPANAMAQVHLPARRTSRILEGGTDISRRNDMFIVSRLDHEAVIAVGSGTYRFEVVEAKRATQQQSADALVNR